MNHQSFEEGSSRFMQPNLNCDPASYHVSNNIDMKVMPGHIETGPQLMINKDGTYFDGKFVINTTIPSTSSYQIGYSQSNNSHHYDIYPQSMAPRQHKLREKERSRLRSQRYQLKPKHAHKIKKKSKSKRCGPTPPRFLTQKMNERQSRKHRSQLQSSKSCPKPIPIQPIYINPSPISPIYVPSPITSSDSCSYYGGSGSEKENGDSRSVIDPMFSMNTNTDVNITLPINNINVNHHNDYKNINQNTNSDPDPMTKFPDLRVNASKEHGNELKLENANNPRIIPIEACLDFYIANV